MERLTFYDEFGEPCYRTKTYSGLHMKDVDTVISGSPVARKLAAYEDAVEQGEIFRCEKCGGFKHNVGWSSPPMIFHRTCRNCGHMHYIYEDRHREDMAKGRLITLPCAVGSTIYRLTTDAFNGASIMDCEVTVAHIFSDEVVFGDESDDEFTVSDIGKTVFLTREEAESALATQKGCDGDVRPCDRDCLCHTCVIPTGRACGGCFEDRLDECRAGGLTECKGYIKRGDGG